MLELRTAPSPSDQYRTLHGVSIERGNASQALEQGPICAMLSSLDNRTMIDIRIACDLLQVAIRSMPGTIMVHVLLQSKVADGL